MAHFDVFLSYKNLDENGNNTPEVALADQLYRLLIDSGLQVFYSHYTIGIIGESKYKEVIDDALDEASMLIAIGSSAENLNSNWVKYEWDSFYMDILSGRKDGLVISFTQNMSNKDLPRTLRHLQSFGNGLNDLDNVCDFVANAIKRLHPKPEVNENQVRIVSFNELLSQGFSPLDIANAITNNDQYLYHDIPSECAGTPLQWAEHFQRYPDFCSFVLDCNNHIIGNYSFTGLTEEDDDLMSKGEFKECELDSSKGNNLYDKGTHIGYLLNLSVNPFAESSAMYQLLWDSFTEMLKKAATIDQIYFSKIYYKAFLPEHEAKVASKGFRYCCKDKTYGKVFVHDMDPESTLLVLDKDLAEIYSNWRKKQKWHNVLGHTDIEAMAAHMDFWKQIEELFYHPKYYRLKKYFMGANFLPQNSAEHKIGLAIAGWIRDILKYSSALLPFLSNEMKETHYQFEKQFLSSELIKEYIEQDQPVRKEPLAVNDSTDIISVKSITTFAHIWLDIDKLFMESDLIDLKPYFYEKKDTLPDDSMITLCEGLALRILTGMKISEDQLRYIPGEFVESYYDFKFSICNAAIMKNVFSKYPFIKKEINWC